MAVTMPVIPPCAPVRRAASLLLLANSLHTSVTVVPSGIVTAGWDQSNRAQPIESIDRPNRSINRSRQTGKERKRWKSVTHETDAATKFKMRHKKHKQPKIRELSNAVGRAP